LTVLVQNEEGIAFSDAYTSPSVVSNHYLLSLGAANGYGSFLLGLYDGAGTYEAGMDLGYNDLAGYWEFKLYAGDDWLTIIDGEFRFNGDSVWYQGNANFAAGSGTVSSSWTSVSFSKTFASPPKVFAGYAEDFSGDSGILKVRNVTKTGFEWVIGGSFTSRNANWLAILI